MSANFENPIDLESIESNPNETLEIIKKDAVDRIESCGKRHQTLEESFTAMSKEDKFNNQLKLWDIMQWLVVIGVVVSAIGIFIGIDQWIEQKHIDSGTPYIRGITPNGYLIEQIKLKDGTTWDILCIDGVKTIYDIDKRLVSETNLACF